MPAAIEVRDVHKRFGSVLLDSFAPPFWQGLSHFNPFFYMIDGFRYGFFGVSDVDPLRSLAVVGAFLAVVSGMTLAILKSGYRLRH